MVEQDYKQSQQTMQIDFMAMFRRLYKQRKRFIKLLV